MYIIYSSSSLCKKNLWVKISRIHFSYPLIRGEKPNLIPLYSFADFLYPCVELDAYSSKVHNLIWSDQDYSQRQHLFSCGPDGIITWWNIKTCLDRDPVFEVSVLYSFVLPPAKQRWVSAVVVLPNHGKEQSVGEATLTIESCVVVCGDRKGSLHLFHPKSCVPLNEKVSASIISAIFILDII